MDSPIRLKALPNAAALVDSPLGFQNSNYPQLLSRLYTLMNHRQRRDYEIFLLFLIWGLMVGGKKRGDTPPLLKRWVNSLAWWIAWVDGQLVITIIGGGGGLGYEDSTQ